MTELGSVWSSQLRISAGRAVDEAPQVGFVEKRDGSERIVRLSLLAEPVADGAEAFMDLFVRRLGDLFDPAERSLTGAVKFALATAHEELRQWNRERVASDHAMYGVSALIQRAGQPSVLALAGPSLALVAGDAGAAGLRALTLYEHSLRQTYARAGGPVAMGGGDDPVASPLGSSQPLMVEFVPASVEGSGWVLLLTSNTRPLLDAERRVALSPLTVEDTLSELYPAMLGLRDAAALVVGRPTAAAPPSQPPPQEAQQPMQSAPLGQSPPLETPPAQIPETPLPAASVAPEVVEEQPLSEAPPAAAPTAEPPVEPPAPESRIELVQPRWQLTFAPAAELEVAGWPSNPFVVSPAEQLATAPAAPSAPPASPREPLMQLGKAIPSLRERRDEPAVERPRISLRDARGRNPGVRRLGLALAAMLVVLTGVAAVLLGPSLLQSDEDAFRARVEQARNGLAASQLAATTEAARLALIDARTDVEAALGLNPLASEAQLLRDEIEAVLAELNLVQPPGELSALADLSGYGPSLALGVVRFGGGRAFVLDDAGGRVFSVSEAGSASIIFQEGEPLGMAGQPVGQSRTGQPISIAWQPLPGTTEGDAAGEAALWILDAHARLYRWTPSGVLLVQIPEQERLGSVDAVAATAGSVYLLDAAGGAVWRFAVERSQLGAPLRAVGRTDLAGAHELAAAVTSSGAVTFLAASSDGRLRRFSAGQELPLAVGLQRGLLSPASISMGTQSGLVYAVDRGAGRLIVVAPDGGVVGQIQSPELAQLRGAWVDEATGQIIYALPERVLVGRLPARAE